MANTAVLRPYDELLLGKWGRCYPCYDEKRNTVGIITTADAASGQPKPLDSNLLAQLGSFAAKKAFSECYYAAFHFQSTDEERCKASLALRGDGFYASFSGMKEVPIGRG